MSTFTNTSKHSATMSNLSRNSATMSNPSKTIYYFNLLREEGSAILLENGDNILLQSQSYVTTMTNLNKS